jgi:hypothetical protein
VLTLALCIGVNTSIFSMMNAVMLKSLPVRDPQHLLVLQWSARHAPKVHDFIPSGDCVAKSGDVNPHGCSLSKPWRSASAGEARVHRENRRAVPLGRGRPQRMCPTYRRGSDVNAGTTACESTNRP